MTHAVTNDKAVLILTPGYDLSADRQAVNDGLRGLADQVDGLVPSFGSFCEADSGRPTQADTIPNRFHFCFGMAPGAQFVFAHYLAVKSAHMVNKPESITLYYAYRPAGEWWDAVQRFATLRQIEPIEEIYGRKLCHFAHRAGVLRLQTLHREGGIYMDADTLCLRPFMPLLGLNEVVMGLQGAEGYGLCDAVILAQPRAAFIDAWLRSYASFRSEGLDQFWDEHAVKKPLELMREPALAGRVTALDWRSFFYPDYFQAAPLFEDSDVAPWDGAYCLHLWETVNMAHVLRITPQSVRDGNHAYAKLARRFVTDETGVGGEQ